MDEPEKSKIGITDYNSYQKLIDGYSGGAVDVYKPRSPIGKNVHCYDFNSLYPSISLSIITYYYLNKSF